MFQYIDGSYAELILKIEATRIRPVWEDAANEKICGSRVSLIIAAITALGVGALKLAQYL